MSQQIALVTGANRGIGLELTQQLLARGRHVIAACRKPSPALEASGAEVVTGIDVADDRVGGRLAAAVDGRPLQLLINNAGILTSESLADLDLDRIRRQFEINSLGPLRVTQALLPNLSSGSKVAIVTSRMGSIGDNTSGSRYGYRMSKAAVNMAGVSLAQDLQGRGIAVALLHPGLVATAMTGHNGIDPAEAASGLLARIEDLSLATSGTFWHQNGDILPW